jgi:light-harvesting complex I chlorophyll a/b binding protein 4
MLSLVAIAPTSFAARTAGVKMQVEAPAVEAPPVLSAREYAQTLPGITDPLGFFDPLDCTAQEGVTLGKVRFYREVELKHGRVAMLAALGYPVAEQFHPFFGGEIDSPSFVAFQASPLQNIWPLVVFAISIFEVFSVFSFEKPLVRDADGNLGDLWSIPESHVAGDFGFDPLGLKPTTEAELVAMQTKELNNGRLAMLAIAGMVAQEAATGGKLF